MSPSLSWIDRERWSRLLERSGVPEPGGGPTGPVVSIPLRRTPSSLLSPPLDRPGTQREERAPRFRGNLDERLQQLLFWIGGQTGAEVLFVADDVGLPLLSVGPVAELATVSAVLSAAYAKLWPLEDERHPAFTSLLFAGSRTLTVIEATTALGRFALGFLRDGFTDPSLLRRIRHELKRAFNEKGEVDG